MAKPPIPRIPCDALPGHEGEWIDLSYRPTVEEIGAHQQYDNVLAEYAVLAKAKQEPSAELQARADTAFDRLRRAMGWRIYRWNLTDEAGRPIVPWNATDDAGQPYAELDRDADALARLSVEECLFLRAVTRNIEAFISKPEPAKKPARKKKG